MSDEAREAPPGMREDAAVVRRGMAEAVASGRVVVTVRLPVDVTALAEISARVVELVPGARWVQVSDADGALLELRCPGGGGDD